MANAIPQLARPTSSRKLRQFIVVLTIALSFVGFLIWIRSGPEWLLTAGNTENGLVVAIHQSGAPTPIYSVVLPHQTIPREFSRVARRDLDPALGATTFYDDTMKPGRWTVFVGTTKFDIMEVRLVVNDQTELTPGQTVVLP
jgi:hypothetical protein